MKVKCMIETPNQGYAAPKGHAKAVRLLIHLNTPTVVTELIPVIAIIPAQFVKAFLECWSHCEAHEKYHLHCMYNL